MDKNLENDLTNINILLEKVKNYSFDFLENINKIPAFGEYCFIIKNGAEIIAVQLRINLTKMKFMIYYMKLNIYTGELVSRLRGSY